MSSTLYFNSCGKVPQQHWILTNEWENTRLLLPTDAHRQEISHISKCVLHYREALQCNLKICTVNTDVDAQRKSLFRLQCVLINLKMCSSIVVNWMSNLFLLQKPRCAFTLIRVAPTEGLGWAFFYYIAREIEPEMQNVTAEISLQVSLVWLIILFCILLYLHVPDTDMDISRSMLAIFVEEGLEKYCTFSGLWQIFWCLNCLLIYKDNDTIKM